MQDGAGPVGFAASILVVLRCGARVSRVGSRTDLNLSTSIVYDESTSSAAAVSVDAIRTEAVEVVNR